MKPSEAPDGFEPLDLISGYSVAFGPVYLNRSERKLGFRVEKSHLNPFGLCHGGAMATFADLQVIAVKDGPGIKPGFSPTVSMSVDYLSPARLGDWVEATVTLAEGHAVADLHPGVDNGERRNRGANDRALPQYRP